MQNFYYLMENILKVLRSNDRSMLRPCSYYTPEEFGNEGFTLKTQNMFSVHTTPEEFENKGFTVKTHHMFSVHTTLEESEIAANVFSPHYAGGI